MSALWVNALSDAGSGIGVIQRELELALAREWRLVRARQRRLSLAGARERSIGEVVRTALELRHEMFPQRPEDPVDAALATKPPYPMRRLAPRQVVMVHDLRWRWRRSPVATRYRLENLRFALRRADAIACISGATRDDVAELFPDVVDRLHVTHCGPGRAIAPGFAPSPSRHGVLLLGGAPHKRLGDMVQAIVDVDPTWVDAVTLVNPSPAEDDAVDRLRRTSRTVTVLQRPTDEELWSRYGSAAVVLAMGTDEGFGFVPFEALRAGADVVVADVPLSHELFDGVAGVAIRSADDLSWLRSRPEPTGGQPVGDRYSWEAMAAAVDGLLRS